NVQIAGSAISTFGSSAASNGRVSLSPIVNGASNGANVQIEDAAAGASAGTGSLLYMETAEASRTTVRYGITLGNYAEISAFNSGLNGLIIGTNPAKPLIFGTNDTFAGFITGSSQQWTVG